MRHSHSLASIAAAAALCLSATGLQPTGAAAADVTVASPSCGNGLLEGGESCESCPADCAPLPCTPDGKRQPVLLAFTAPKESLGGDVRSFTPVAATLLVTYRTNRLQLPAQGTAPAVRARLSEIESPSENVIANDLDYALRLVVTDTKKLASKLASIEFDTCQGSPAPTDADLGCVVEACAGHGGPLADCYCTATVSPAAAK
jgi:hypothetical protein